jgi:anti-anti-sigma factor
MEILQDRDGAAAIVAPAGRIDGASAPALRAALDRLDAAGERLIVVDLGGVDYISSAGLAVLLWLAKHLRETGGALAICALRDQVHRVFDLAGYTPLFAVTVTRREAVARVGARPT